MEAWGDKFWGWANLTIIPSFQNNDSRIYDGFNNQLAICLGNVLKRSLILAQSSHTQIMKEESSLSFLLRSKYVHLGDILHNGY